MSKSNADKLASVISGGTQYGIEIDSALRTIGETLPATFCLKWFAALDDSSASFRDSVLEMLEVARKTERLESVSFETDFDSQTQESGEVEYTTALRIRFSSKDAAYFQFHVFPPDLDFVSGWSRKRDGDSQVLLLTLRSREYLDEFVSVCRRNPHFVGIETITEDEFAQAPSNGV